MAICGCGLPPHCCQPAVAGGVIYADSGVSLALTWPRRLCLLRVLLCVSCCYKLSPFKHTGLSSTLRPACLFTAHVGCGSSLLSCGVFFPPLLWSFPPSATLTSFPAPGRWARASAPAGASLARPGLFIYSSGKDSVLLQHSGRPILFAKCLYCSYCLLLSFSFFPGWGLVCPQGYADLAQACLWKYHVPLSSPCPCLPKPSG
jgi:hypothetical protein